MTAHEGAEMGPMTCWRQVIKEKNHSWEQTIFLLFFFLYFYLAKNRNGNYWEGAFSLDDLLIQSSLNFICQQFSRIWLVSSAMILLFQRNKDNMCYHLDSLVTNKTKYFADGACCCWVLVILLVVLSFTEKPDWTKKDKHCVLCGHLLLILLYHCPVTQRSHTSVAAVCLTNIRLPAPSDKFAEQPQATDGFHRCCSI